METRLVHIISVNMGTYIFKKTPCAQQTLKITFGWEMENNK